MLFTTYQRHEISCENVISENILHQFTVACIEPGHMVLSDSENIRQATKPAGTVKCSEDDPLEAHQSFFCT